MTFRGVSTLIRAFNNENRPILAGNKPVERIYFNLIKLAPSQTFQYRLPQFETVIVPLAGACDLSVDDQTFSSLGDRARTKWGGSGGELARQRTLRGPRLLVWLPATQARCRSAGRDRPRRTASLAFQPADWFRRTALVHREFRLNGRNKKRKLLKCKMQAPMCCRIRRKRFPINALGRWSELRTDLFRLSGIMRFRLWPRRISLSSHTIT